MKKKVTNYLKIKEQSELEYFKISVINTATRVYGKAKRGHHIRKTI